MPRVESCTPLCSTVYIPTAVFIILQMSLIPVLIISDRIYRFIYKFIAAS